jgi:putative Ca2+/H+ antiporter (TMEM165/GDT1 family)
MNGSVTATLIAIGAVTLAEMGDKTQLLAMAFACRYKAAKVMTGVFIATVLNHAAAVALGTLVARNEALNVWIQGIAALSFLFFGLWTIRGDRLDGEENRKTRFGPVITVAIAFFIAELGDKTQLATIALAARFPDFPVGVLLGSTTGMMIADGIGILVGVVMCRRIPERTIKLVSAGAFILFGLAACWQVMDGLLRFPRLAAAVTLLLLAVATAVPAVFLIRKARAEAVANPVVAQYCKVKKLEP